MATYPKLPKTLAMKNPFMQEKLKRLYNLSNPGLMLIGLQTAWLMVISFNI